MNTPVLMVHGMCCTGEVWSNFRSHFEQRGARVYTPTLRPELRVGLRERPPRALRDLRFSNYVDDLELEIQRIEDETGKTPAVIGHSMGGLLSQALTARGRVSAGVFISPAAAAGVHTLQWRLFWSGFSFAYRRRWTSRAIRPDRRMLDRMVFNALPAGERAAVAAAMVFESTSAFADLANCPIDESRIRVPTLTVAGGRDRLVPTSLVRLTARKLAASGGEFREYKHHGHWLYAEPGWEETASDIYAWLAKATQPALERAGSARAADLQPTQ